MQWPRRDTRCGRSLGGVLDSIDTLTVPMVARRNGSFYGGGLDVSPLARWPWPTSGSLAEAGCQTPARRRKGQDADERESFDVWHPRRVRQGRGSAPGLTCLGAVRLIRFDRVETGSVPRSLGQLDAPDDVCVRLAL
jgi:hypothetical protein